MTMEQKAARYKTIRRAVIKVARERSAELVKRRRDEEDRLFLESVL